MLVKSGTKQQLLNKHYQFIINRPSLSLNLLNNILKKSLIEITKTTPNKHAERIYQSSVSVPFKHERKKETEQMSKKIPPFIVPT